MPVKLLAPITEPFAAIVGLHTFIHSALANPLPELSVRFRNDTPESLLEYVNASANLLSIAVAAFAALIGLGLYNRRKDRLLAIEKQLNSFHRPLLQYLQTSADLHAALLVNRDSQSFRVIHALMTDRDQFSETEKMVIMEIVWVGERIESIIDEASGFLEDENLREPLGKLVSHIRIFRWAARDCEQGDSKIVDYFFYPRHVNGRIKDEYKRLSDNLRKVRRQIW